MSFEDLDDLRAVRLVELGQHDAYPDDQVAASGVPAGLRQALPRQVDLLAVPGVGPHPELQRAGRRGDRRLGTGDRLGQSDRQLGAQVRPDPREALVGLDPNGDVQVPGGCLARVAQAGAAELDAGAIGHAGRDLDLEPPPVEGHHALRAARHLGQAHLGVGSHVRPARAGTRSRRGPAARTTARQVAEVDDLLEAAAAPGAGSAPARRTGAEGARVVAEEGAEEVGEATHLVRGHATVRVAHAARPASRGERPGTEGATPLAGAGGAAVLLVCLPVGAQLVVALALLGVGEDGVGLVGVLEALLGGLVVGVAVRMQLTCQAAVGLLDLGLRRRLRHTQDLVVVLVVHPNRPPTLSLGLWSPVAVRRVAAGPAVRPWPWRRSADGTAAGRPQPSGVPRARP